jgi:hypothetical protein
MKCSKQGFNMLSLHTGTRIPLDYERNSSNCSRTSAASVLSLKLVEEMSPAREAGASMKPGLERSGTPGLETAHRKK